MNQIRNFVAIFLGLISFQNFAQISAGGSPQGFKDFSIVKSAPVFEIEAFDPSPLIAEDEINNQFKDRPYRFGKNIPVSINLDDHGSWTELENGDRIWTIAIKSPGAFSLNFVFDYFHLVPGGKFFIYNAALDHVIGAFTEANNREDHIFATDLVKGDFVILEYYEPAEFLGQSRIDISQVTHAYRDMFKVMKGFGTSGSCNMNVNCPQGLPWQDQKRSVVMLVSGGNGFCTGVVVNNTLNDGTPYVLTANHCGGSGFATWVFRFNWEAPACANPASSPTSQSITGSISRASNSGSDFRLLELSSSIPSNYNAYFSGWDNTGTAPSSSVCIHHPDGDIKKISFDEQAAISTNFGGAAVWEVGSWEYGTTTEPGSSGSPLFNQDGRIIGQLFGGSAACGNLLSDYYGKFSTSWNGSASSNRLHDWLDPNASGTGTINGFDPNVPSLAIDAGVIGFNNPLDNSERCSDTVVSSILIKNFGINTLSSITIYYGESGSALNSTTWTGSLASGATTAFTLPVIQLNNGLNELIALTDSPNGSSDMNQGNDTARIAVTLQTPSSVPIPLTEDLQSAAFPSNGWTILNPDGSATWQRTTSAGGFGLSSASMRVNNYNYSAAGARDYYLSPYFDLSNATSPRIFFDVAYARFNNSNIDSLIVSVSDDCGLSWTRIYWMGGAPLTTNGGGFVSTSFVPTSQQWRTDSAELISAAGKSQVRVRFENYNGFGNNLYVDNINISNISSLSEYYEVPGLKIFPNPSAGSVTIRLEEYGQWNLYDLAGKDITRGLLNKGDNQLDLKLASGIYLLSVQTERGKSSEKLIIH